MLLWTVFSSGLMYEFAFLLKRPVSMLHSNKAFARRPLSST